MDSTQNEAELTLGRALLLQLPDRYFAILKSTHLETTADHGIACTYTIPGNGKCTISASSSIEAIRLMLMELASLIEEPAFAHMELQKAVEECSTLEPSPGGDTKVERFQSKTRQMTVGVSMPRSLKERLNTLAESQNTSFAEVARKCAVFGFDDFIDRSLYSSSKSLFELLEQELAKWQHSDSEQVMLRLAPGPAVSMRTAALEHGRSASEMGALCMAHGIALQEELVLLEQKVASCKGAKIRPLLAQIGMGAYAATLLSGVLAGQIRAPKSILGRLASVFEAPETLLAFLFRRSFERRVVPAFKAEHGKPEVSMVATSWDTAVKSMGLSAEQTKELLDLGTKRT
jgi:hypothetical protein